MSLLYLDSSALVKLVRAEPETASLRAFVSGAAMVASELVLAEVPRALRRAANAGHDAHLDELIGKASEVLDAVALQALDHVVLAAAGALDLPTLRSLDAIHLVAAVSLSPLDAFVSYDQRQAAAARIAGLRTVAPGQ